MKNTSRPITDWLSVSAPADYTPELPQGIRPENIAGFRQRHIQRRGLEMIVTYARDSLDRNYGRMFGPRFVRHGQTWPDGWRIEVLRRPILDDIRGLQIGPAMPIRIAEARQIKSVLRPGLVLDSYRLPPLAMPEPFEVDAVSGWWVTETGETFTPGMAATSLHLGQQFRRREDSADGALRVGREWRLYVPKSPSVIDYLLGIPAAGWDRAGRYWTLPGGMADREVYRLMMPLTGLYWRDMAGMTAAERGAQDMAGWMSGLRPDQQTGLRNRFGYDHIAVAATKLGSLK